MKELGAKDALYLDDINSSIIIILNELSDVKMGSTSNGILVFRGGIPEKPVVILGEDNINQFLKQANLFIDEFNNIIFYEVLDATRNLIYIDEKICEASTTILSMNNFNSNEYEISISVK